VRITVATYNAPNRLKPHGRGFQWLADQGADIICAQEHTDKNDWSPRGWRRWRPTGTDGLPGDATSNTIYYNPKVVRLKKKGTIQMSSPDFRNDRDIVWAHFRTRKGGHPLRVSSIHLPAFYTKNPKNRREYDRQAKKLAAWVKGGRNRVVAGDFNGTKGRKRMAPIDAVTRLSRAVRSGPSGQRIDYVGARRGGRWRVVKTVRGKKFRSDHASVLVTLEWKG
jgi:endonuclease/exonuclease/phosphatase family metal-dependent hydrolase